MTWVNKPLALFFSKEQTSIASICRRMKPWQESGGVFLRIRSFFLFSHTLKLHQRIKIRIIAFLYIRMFGNTIFFQHRHHIIRMLKYGMIHQIPAFSSDGMSGKSLFEKIVQRLRFLALNGSYQQ